MKKSQVSISFWENFKRLLLDSEGSMTATQKTPMSVLLLHMTISLISIAVILYFLANYPLTVILILGFIGGFWFDRYNRSQPGETIEIQEDNQPVYTISNTPNKIPEDCLIKSAKRIEKNIIIPIAARSVLDTWEKTVIG